MDICDLSMNMNLQSLQNALQISVLQKTMNQDMMAVNAVIEGMAEVSQNTAEPSFCLLDTRA